MIRLEPIARAHASRLIDAIEASAANLSVWLGPRYTPRTAEAVAAFIDDWSAGAASSTHFGFIAIDDDGRCVGFGLINQVNEFHRFANLGYWVRTGETGKGVATEVTRLLADFGFHTLNLERIELVIEVSNVASQRVAEKAGAVREGLLRRRLAGREGASRDAYMFSLIRENSLQKR
jgi:ribosomal-protein-alanine N-acetyltransferase